VLWLGKSCSPKEHTLTWVLPFLQTHFHHAEDFPADKGNGATRLTKSFLEQTLIKENLILAEPFKIQTVCSRYGELNSAAFQQALRQQRRGHYVHVKGIRISPCALKISC